MPDLHDIDIQREPNVESVIDIEARQGVAQGHAEFIELATDYWGKDGKNGHRSRSLAAQERLGILEKDFTRFKDKERKDTCFGIVALAEHVEHHDEILAKAIAAEIMKLNDAARKNKTMIQWVQVFAPYFATAVALFLALRK